MYSNIVCQAGSTWLQPAGGLLAGHTLPSVSFCGPATLQDSVNTWLADACQAGARIITGGLSIAGQWAEWVPSS